MSNGKLSAQLQQIEIQPTRTERRLFTDVSGVPTDQQIRSDMISQNITSTKARIKELRDLEERFRQKGDSVSSNFYRKQRDVLESQGMNFIRQGYTLASVKEYARLSAKKGVAQAESRLEKVAIEKALAKQKPKIDVTKQFKQVTISPIVQQRMSIDPSLRSFYYGEPTPKSFEFYPTTKQVSVEKAPTAFLTQRIDNGKEVIAQLERPLDLIKTPTTPSLSQRSQAIQSLGYTELEIKEIKRRAGGGAKSIELAIKKKRIELFGGEPLSKSEKAAAIVGEKVNLPLYGVKVKAEKTLVARGEPVTQPRVTAIATGSLIGRSIRNIFSDIEAIAEYDRKQLETELKGTKSPYLGLVSGIEKSQEFALSSVDTALRESETEQLVMSKGIGLGARGAEAAFISAQLYGVGKSAVKTFKSPKVVSAKVTEPLIARVETVGTKSKARTLVGEAEDILRTVPQIETDKAFKIFTEKPQVEKVVVRKGLRKFETEAITAIRGEGVKGAAKVEIERALVGFPKSLEKEFKVIRAVPTVRVPEGGVGFERVVTRFDEPITKVADLSTDYAKIELQSQIGLEAPVVKKAKVISPARRVSIYDIADQEFDDAIKNVEKIVQRGQPKELIVEPLFTAREVQTPKKLIVETPISKSKGLITKQKGVSVLGVTDIDTGLKSPEIIKFEATLKELSGIEKLPPAIKIKVPKSKKPITSIFKTIRTKEGKLIRIPRAITKQETITIPKEILDAEEIITDTSKSAEAITASIQRIGRLDVTPTTAFKVKPTTAVAIGLGAKEVLRQRQSEEQILKQINREAQATISAINTKNAQAEKQRQRQIQKSITKSLQASETLLREQEVFIPKARFPTPITGRAGFIPIPDIDLEPKRRVNGKKVRRKAEDILAYSADLTAAVFKDPALELTEKEFEKLLRAPKTGLGVRRPIKIVEKKKKSKRRTKK